MTFSQTPTVDIESLFFQKQKCIFFCKVRSLNTVFKAATTDVKKSSKISVFLSVI